MDPDVASALFSPSKARQQQAQAKDWDFVTSWLRKQYFPKPIPGLERNEETLQALLTLAAFNERADEEQGLVERVEKEALKEMEAQVDSPLDDSIYQALSSNLSPSQRVALDSQAHASILLAALSADATALAQRTIRLTTTSFEQRQQLARIADLQSSLIAEHRRLALLLTSLQPNPSPDAEAEVDAHADVYARDTAAVRGTALAAPPADLPQKTAEWTRNTKTMRSKLREYDERLASMGAAPAGPDTSIEVVAARKAELDALETRLARLEDELRWFGDVPADAGRAREVLEDSRRGLRGLIEERDRLFEGLVEGGGGVRGR
ncbi:hypothetical protein MBLNU459_g2598t1 [Dothideomycetes sp. NU459]